ncbi:MAG: Ig-like domain-containing protein [Thermoleophilia bacterium]
MAQRPWQRPVRAFGTGALAAALIAGASAPVLGAPDTTLDFGAAVDGTLPDSAGAGTGFTGTLGGSGSVPANLLLDTAAPGLLKVTTTSGDAAASPSSQDNALAVKVDGSGGYVVETRIAAPLDLTQPLQSAGIMVGTDQNNYVKAVVRKSAGGADQMQALVERLAQDPGDPFETVQKGVVGLPAAEAIDLRLTVAPDGTVTGEFAFGDANWQPIGSFALAAAAGEEVWAGIISTHSGSATPFTVGYDMVRVDVPPALVGVTPAGGASGVPAAGAVTATFDQPMDAGSLTTAFTLEPEGSPGAPVAGTVTLGGDGTVATFTPSAALQPGTRYVVSVGAGATDTSGHALTNPATSAFTTAATPSPVPPSGGTSGSGALCATVPARAAASGSSGTIRLRPAQLLINQRISQAAVRRSNAVQAWLDAGIATRDLCGRAFAATAFRGVTFGTAGTTAAAEPATPRPFTVARASGSATGTVELSPEQLLINQRISQAAVRRSNALQARLDAGLTGGDLADGALTAGKLVPGIAVTGTSAAPAAPASVTRVAAGSAGSGGRVEATVAQLRINQRISQAAVRRSNALIDRLSRGLSGSDFAPGSVGAADLAPALRTQRPAS